MAGGLSYFSAVDSPTSARQAALAPWLVSRWASARCRVRRRDREGAGDAGGGAERIVEVDLGVALQLLDEHREQGPAQHHPINIASLGQFVDRWPADAQQLSPTGGGRCLDRAHHRKAAGQPVAVDVGPQPLDPEGRRGEDGEALPG